MEEVKLLARGLDCITQSKNPTVLGVGGGVYLFLPHFSCNYEHQRSNFFHL